MRNITNSTTAKPATGGNSEELQKEIASLKATVEQKDKDMALQDAELESRFNTIEEMEKRLVELMEQPQGGGGGSQAQADEINRLQAEVRKLLERFILTSSPGSTMDERFRANRGFRSTGSCRGSRPVRPNGSHRQRMATKIRRTGILRQFLLVSYLRIIRSTHAKESKLNCLRLSKSLAN